MFPCSSHSTARHGKRGSAKQPATRGSEGSRTPSARSASSPLRTAPAGSRPVPPRSGPVNAQPGGAAAALRPEPRCSPARRGARGWRWAAAPPRGGAGPRRPQRPAPQPSERGRLAVVSGSPSRFQGARSSWASPPETLCEHRSGLAACRCPLISLQARVLFPLTTAKSQVAARGGLLRAPCALRALLDVQIVWGMETEGGQWKYNPRGGQSN